MNQAAIITVYGRVQGVGFRYHTRKQAEVLRITGFVQNKPDGSVYIEAEGEHLDEFIQWLRIGPAWARIREVVIHPGQPVGYTEFVIR
ncbi:MAG: acylphosphatase [Bacteroidales bacterium]|jgi:acylphosphatase|nr:acylphosphatase [Bacteroidales bacterium]MDD3701425.1 acylphosphatase [Bacteroidales bacterium]MDY0369500.1 acylphosphatase [Bacteroidales bacterium]